MYDSQRNIVGMSQVLVIPQPVPVDPDMPRGKSAQTSIQKNLGAPTLNTDTEEQSPGSENSYKSEPEEEHLQDCGTSEDKQEEVDLIPYPSLHGLGFKIMLKYAMPSKKSIM